jgi:hypothetical protein
MFLSSFLKEEPECFVKKFLRKSTGIKLRKKV